MVVNVWQPTLTLQPGSVMASSLVSQPIPSSSQMPTRQPIPQPKIK